MSRIFIAYRRTDSAYAAQSIYDALVAKFGKGAVVFDVDTVPLAADFRVYLSRAVARCDLLLAIVGGSWLETVQEQAGSSRDFVRIEIELALELGIAVLPVLVGDAKAPEESDLPPTISALAYRNAALVRAGKDRDSDLESLVLGVEGILAKAPPPRPAPAPLAIKLSVKPPEGAPGQQFKWTATIRNEGKKPLRSLNVKLGGRSVQAPFDLGAGKGRRFTSFSSYEATGLKTWRLIALSQGTDVRVETHASVRVVAPRGKTSHARRRRG